MKQLLSFIFLFSTVFSLATSPLSFGGISRKGYGFPFAWKEVYVPEIGKGVTYHYEAFLLNILFFFAIFSVIVIPIYLIKKKRKKIT